MKKTYDFIKNHKKIKIISARDMYENIYKNNMIKWK